MTLGVDKSLVTNNLDQSANKPEPLALRYRKI